jgi:hypothetical protein
VLLLDNNRKIITKEEIWKTMEILNVNKEEAVLVIRDARDQLSESSNASIGYKLFLKELECWKEDLPDVPEYYQRSSKIVRKGDLK